LLALPIVRPFLRGNRRGFRDQAEVSSLHSSNFPGDVDDVDGDDGATPHDKSDAPSRFDRAVMKHSISQGITGTNDDVILPTSYSTNDIHSMNRLDSMGTNRNDGNSNPSPIQWGRLLTQIFNGNGRPRQIKLIEQLHGHIRKEDWSLATELLNVHPELARTWYNIERLYGGKYDGEALPLHAACALHPPPSFVKFLSDCYPEGLLEKDKAFGRVPLHVACRSLADSSVLTVLAELEPRAVEERDNLMRVPLHYLIKNYSTFGDDDEEVDYECPSNDESADAERDGEKCDFDNIENPNEPKSASNTDGMDSMKILVKTRPNCIRVSDHRGWTPLHVACSCSSRRGMTRVIKFLLREWPESINCKTDKDSDVFNCVDMVGKYHPTKELVNSILKFAQSKVAGKVAEEENTEEEADSSVDYGLGDVDGGTSANDDSDKRLDLLDIHSHEDDSVQTHENESQLINLIQFDDLEEGGIDHKESPVADIDPSVGGLASQDPEKLVDLSQITAINGSDEIRLSLCDEFGRSSSSPGKMPHGNDLLLDIAQGSHVCHLPEGKLGVTSDMGNIDGDLLIEDKDPNDDDNSRGSSLLVPV